MKHLTEMQHLQSDLSLCPECGDPEKETVLRFGAWVLCAGCSHEAFIFLGKPCTSEDLCGLCRRAEEERFDAYVASLEAESRSRANDDINPWRLECDGLRDDDNSKYCAGCRNNARNS